MNKFERFYNFLANMGLVIRDDPAKVIDLTGREWGEVVEGLALSIRELPREDSRQVAGISVVMKNFGTDTKTLSVPPWMFFYKIEGLELSPYGRQFMSAGPKVKSVAVTMGPGDAIETDLPVANIFDVRSAGSYTVRVSCELPGGVVMGSNEVIVRV
jgi:hypothetical protein